MSRGEIQVGEYGFPIELTITNQDGTVVDISTAVTKIMNFTRPDGSTFSKPAVFSGSGSDGKIQYMVADGDMNMSGPWYVQGVVASPSWRHLSTKVPFPVNPN